ncbi:DUF664 domain-containing protein [soil metagenome]
MTSADLLADGFGRLDGIVHRVLEHATSDLLTFRVDPDANSIAWLIWHLSRVQDQTVAAHTGAEQAWEAWRERFGLPFSPRSTGYGHSSADVAAVDVPAELLAGYFDDVLTGMLEVVATQTDADLARVVDESFDPPVTLAVRLVSVLSDSLQHAGQAAFVKGVFERV